MDTEIKKFVGSKGSCMKASEFLKGRGVHCTQSKLQQIVHGDRPCSIKFAIDIESATRGKHKAHKIVLDSIEWWRTRLEKDEAVAASLP